MFHELDMVLENPPAVLLHTPEYNNNEAYVGHREKAQGLFDALSHPLFNFIAVFFFWNVFAVVCATLRSTRKDREWLTLCPL